MKIDWTRKLTSRKLWVSVASFISLIVVAVGGTDSQASQVTALVMAGATVISYIVGEGLVDASYSSSSPEQEKSEEDDDGN
jgi:hypothetical protein